MSHGLRPQITFHEVGFWKTVGMEILPRSLLIIKGNVLHLNILFQCCEPS